MVACSTLRLVNRKREAQVLQLAGVHAASAPRRPREDARMVPSDAERPIRPGRRQDTDDEYEPPSGSEDAEEDDDGDSDGQAYADEARDLTMDRGKGVLVGRRGHQPPRSKWRWSQSAHLASLTPSER